VAGLDLPTVRYAESEEQRGLTDIRSVGKGTER